MTLPPSEPVTYPLGDPDAIAADTIANGYLTADADGVTLAEAYLRLKAEAPVRVSVADFLAGKHSADNAQQQSISADPTGGPR